MASESEDPGEGGDGAKDGVGVLGREADGVVEREGGGHWKNCRRGDFFGVVAEVDFCVLTGVFAKVGGRRWSFCGHPVVKSVARPVC